MTRHEINHASDRQLLARRDAIFHVIRGLASYDEGFDILEDELDLINEELERREHDLSDPSSGLGLHQPS